MDPPAIESNAYSVLRLFRCRFPTRVELSIIAGAFVGVFVSTVVLDDGFFGAVMPVVLGIVALFWLCFAMIPYVIAPTLLRFVIRVQHVVVGPWRRTLLVLGFLVAASVIPIAMSTHFEYPLLIMANAFWPIAVLALMDRHIIQATAARAERGSEWAKSASAWWSRPMSENLPCAVKVWRISILTAPVMFLAFISAAWAILA